MTHLSIIKHFFTVILLLCASFSSAQTFTRNASEDVKQFVERNKPTENSEVAGDIIQAKWNSVDNFIFVFYNVKTIEKIQNEAITIEDLDGYLFIPNGENSFKRIFIGSIGQEGATAEVATLFFSNADKDRHKELIILFSWDQSQHYGISGKLYETHIYDDIVETGNEKVLQPLEHLSKIFKLEFDGTNDSGKNSKAKYTTAAEIRKKLKQLGY